MVTRWPTGSLRPFPWRAPLMRDLSTPLAERSPCIDLVNRDDEIIVSAGLPDMEASRHRTIKIA